MNGTLADARRWAEGFAPLSPALEGVETIVCAPTLHLPLLHASLPESVRLGAEDVSAYTNGAHTGDVSAAMLADAGVDWVIVGHSERRAEAGDTDARVLEKARRAAEAGLRTILCVGETLGERRAGSTEAVLERQLVSILQGLEPGELAAVAYEPVWAIGTGEAASPETAQEVAAHLRALVARHWGEEAAARLPVLYGGSVNEKNAAQFFACPDIDGALVGGASLDPERFGLIAKAKNNRFTIFPSGSAMHFLLSVALVLQIISAVVVIVLVLMQHGKGADLGAAFGSGASGSLFGASGSANFLSRSTAIAATVFFCSTIALTLASGAFNKRAAQPTGGVLGTVEAPAQTTAPAVPAETQNGSSQPLDKNGVPM